MVTTAPTQQDIQNLAWTMLGEAYPGDTAGMSAVGNTVLNRLNSGGYGSTISQIVLAPNQYAAWGVGSQAASQGNHPDTRFPVGSAQYQQAYDLAQQLINGTVPDNTGGAVNYRQTTPGTRWAEGAPGTVSIGGNTFQAGSGLLAGPRPPLPPANIPRSPSYKTSFSPGLSDPARQSNPNGLSVTDFATPQPLPPLPSLSNGPNGLNAGDFFPQQQRVDPQTGRPTFTIPALPTASLPPTTPPPLTPAQQTMMTGRGGNVAPAGLGTPTPPASPPPRMATTSTGKTIQVGKSYDIGGQQYIGGVNAQGVGTLNRVTSPLSGAGPGTVAGGVVGKAIGGALSTAGTNLQNAAGVAGQDITGGLTNVRNAVASGAQGAVNGVGGFLSGIFGGSGNSGNSAPPPIPSGSGPNNLSASDFTYRPPPTVAANSSGSPDERGTNPYAFSIPSPPPIPNSTPQTPAAPTYQNVQITNPAYTTWVESAGDAAQAAARTANPLGGPNGLSAADFAPPPPVRGPAPPQTITVRRPVSAPPMPSQQSYSPPPPQQVQLASGSMANVGQQFTANGYRYQVNANGSTTNLDTGHTYGGTAPSYSQPPSYSYATPGGPNGLSASQFPQPPQGGLAGFWNSTPAGHIFNFLGGNAAASTGGLLNGLTGLFNDAPARPSSLPPGTNLATYNGGNDPTDMHGSSVGTGQASTASQTQAAMAYNAAHPGSMSEWVYGMDPALRGRINPSA